MCICDTTGLNLRLNVAAAPAAFSLAVASAGLVLSLRFYASCAFLNVCLRPEAAVVSELSCLLMNGWYVDTETIPDMFPHSRNNALKPLA